LSSTNAMKWNSVRESGSWSIASRQWPLVYDRSIVEERWNIRRKERSLNWVHGACDPVPVERYDVT
jgi:hypothetical protein